MSEELIRNLWFKIYELEETVRQLRLQLHPHERELEQFYLQRNLGLTASEAIVLLQLYHTKYCVTRDMFLDTLRMRDLAKEEPGGKILDVFLHKLRAKLVLNPDRPTHIPGFYITTVWGRGYLLEPEPRALLTPYLKEREPRP